MHLGQFRPLAQPLGNVVADRFQVIVVGALKFNRIITLRAHHGADLGVGLNRYVGIGDACQLLFPQLDNLIRFHLPVLFQIHGHAGVGTHAQA